MLSPSGPGRGNRARVTSRHCPPWMQKPLAASLVPEGRNLLRPPPFPPQSSTQLLKNPLDLPAWPGFPRGGVPICTLKQRLLEAEKEVSQSPPTVHIKCLTIKTPYKSVKLFFGIVSALARREEWNTYRLFQIRQEKASVIKLNDSTPKRKPAKRRPQQGCRSTLPRNSMRKMHQRQLSPRDWQKEGGSLEGSKDRAGGQRPWRGSLQRPGTQTRSPLPMSFKLNSCNS